MEPFLRIPLLFLLSRRPRCCKTWHPAYSSACKGQPLSTQVVYCFLLSTLFCCLPMQSTHAVHPFLLSASAVHPFRHCLLFSAVCPCCLLFPAYTLSTLSGAVYAFLLSTHVVYWFLLSAHVSDFQNWPCSNVQPLAVESRKDKTRSGVKTQYGAVLPLIKCY